MEAPNTKKRYILVGIFVGVLMISLVSAGWFTGNAVWNSEWCSIDNICPAGEGDCDRPSECATGYCARNVGRNYGQARWLDVCECPNGTGWNGSQCSSTSAICVDSDGRDTFTKGVITGPNWKGRGYSDSTDYCNGTSVVGNSVHEIVLEHYCEDNKVRSFYAVCSNGCQDGACIPDTNKTSTTGSEITYQSVLDVLGNCKKVPSRVGNGKTTQYFTCDEICNSYGLKCAFGYLSKVTIGGSMLSTCKTQSAVRDTDQMLSLPVLLITFS